jgi:hypothetical protein
MGRRRPPPIEEPDKPVGEMPPTELAAYAARLRRTLRDDEVRRGARRPRSAREFEIWTQARAAQDERQAARIAWAERKPERPRSGQDQQPPGNDEQESGHPRESRPRGALPSSRKRHRGA